MFVSAFLNLHVLHSFLIFFLCIFFFFLALLQMAQTPLHFSAGYNRAEIVQFLLDWQGLEKIELEAKNMVGRFNVILFLWQKFGLSRLLCRLDFV